MKIKLNELEITAAILITGGFAIMALLFVVMEVRGL
jgi:hypothetical protein